MIDIKIEIVKDELGLAFWQIQIEENPPVQHANKTQAIILAIGRDEEINHRRLSFDDFNFIK